MKKNLKKELIFSFMLVQTPLVAENDIWNGLEKLFYRTYEKLKDNNKTVNYDCPFKSKDDQNDELQDRWEGFINLSENAIGKINKLDEVKIEKSWVPLLDTRESLNGDINSILDDLLIALSGDTRVMECMNKMRDINREILIERDALTKISERSIAKISEADRNESKIRFEKIDVLNEHLANIRSSLLIELKNLGLDMPDEDLEKILMRIDSSDIIQVMVIFDISKKITSKLEDLIKNDSNNIKLSKRYYGMNLVLSKIALHVQDQYKIALTTNYIPKLQTMVNNLNSLLVETENLLKESKTQYEREIYSNNLKAQKLSIETASLYAKNLQKQLQQVEEGREQAMNNLKLTSNSYKTLQAGVSLLDVIKETQNSFSSIMKIQLPEIIPFKNLQMEQEYHKITEELRDK